MTAAAPFGAEANRATLWRADRRAPGRVRLQTLVVIRWFAVAGQLGALLLLPHLIWLVQNHYLPFNVDRPAADPGQPRRHAHSRPDDEYSRRRQRAGLPLPVYRAIRL